MKTKTMHARRGRQWRRTRRQLAAKHVPVIAIYPGYDKRDDVIHDLFKIHKSRFAGSGYGFGERDIEYDVPENEVKALLSALNRIDGVKAKINER